MSGKRYTITGIAIFDRGTKMERKMRGEKRKKRGDELKEREQGRIKRRGMRKEGVSQGRRVV